ncbi:MAG: EFR1 family ferrodoxin [Spirochaetales bacterium]|nr:EFR1 family ferrodoxin [Spirochaetales bacterium]
MKEILIIYFSGAGNTKIVVDEIAKLLKMKSCNVEAIPVENIESIKNIDFSDKILGIGFPIYGGSYQQILFEKAIECMETQNKKIPAFLFFTYAGFSIDAGTLVGKLKDKNILTIIKKGFKCPSSGWGMFVPEGTLFIKKMLSFDNNLFLKIKEFTEEITSRIDKFNKKPFNKSGLTIPMSRFLVKLTEKWENKFLFNNLTIDKAKCNGCGLCVKKCPVGNIIKKENRIEIVNKDHCLFCQRCITMCPTGAIFWGSNKAHRRYTKEYRDELLKKVKRID